MISPNLTRSISMVLVSAKSVRRFTYYDHQYKQTDTQRPYITNLETYICLETKKRGSWVMIWHITKHSRRLPALGRKLWFQLFFPIKVYPLNLESQNQAENISEFPNQILRQIGWRFHELWSDKQTIAITEITK